MIASVVLVCWAVERCRCSEVPQVIFATDAEQFHGLAGALTSLKVHAAEHQKVGVTIVTSKTDAPRARNLAKCVGFPKARVLSWEHTNVTRLPISTPEDFHNTKGLHKYGNLTSVLNYVRFFLPELVPHAETLLYLDSDLIVKCDVAEFLLNDCRREFDENANATILVANRHYKDDDPSERHLSLSNRKDHLFNAGVFVADVGRWRQCRNQV